VGSFCTLKDAGIDIRGLQLARSLFSALSALEGAAAYSGDFPLLLAIFCVSAGSLDFCSCASTLSALPASE
jgi:hypothetical protein